jgi:hypothetical protein
MKKHSFKFGSIEYRLPDVSEGMILMGRMGINFDDENENENDENQELIYVGKLIKHLGPFVNSIDVTINEEKIDSYKDCLKFFEMMEPLSFIAGKVMASMEVSKEKKPQSGKQ